MFCLMYIVANDADWRNVCLRTTVPVACVFPKEMIWKDVASLTKGMKQCLALAKMTVTFSRRFGIKLKLALQRYHNNDNNVSIL